MEKEQLELKKLIDSYEVILNNNKINVERKLKGISNIKEFFQHEYNFWSPLSDKGNIIPNNMTYINDCIIKSDNILQNYKSWDKQTIEREWNQLRDCATRLSNTSNTNLLLIFSFTAHAEFLKGLYERNVHIAETAHNYFLDINVNIVNDKQAFEGYIRAYTFDLQADSELFTRKGFEKKAFTRLSKQMLEKSDEVNKSFDSVTSELDTWKNKFTSDTAVWSNAKQKEFNDYLEDKKSKMGEFEKLYSEKLKLEAPVQYWIARASKYRSSGKIWVSLLTITILISVIVLLRTLYDLPPAFGYKLFNGEPQAVRGVVIFLTLISFLAYLTKTFSKLTFSSFHLVRDAEEREQLTLVSLALLKNGSIKDEERQLVLQSLFSRSDTGLLSKDGSPTFPDIKNLFKSD